MCVNLLRVVKMVQNISEIEEQWLKMGQKSRVQWLKNRVNELGDFNQAWAELLLFFEAEYKQVKKYNQEAHTLLTQCQKIMVQIDEKLDTIQKVQQTVCLRNGNGDIVKKKEPSPE